MIYFSVIVARGFQGCPDEQIFVQITPTREMRHKVILAIARGISNMYIIKLSFPSEIMKNAQQRDVQLQGDKHVWVTSLINRGGIS